MPDVTLLWDTMVHAGPAGSQHKDGKAPPPAPARAGSKLQTDAKAPPPAPARAGSKLSDSKVPPPPLRVSSKDKKPAQPGSIPAPPLKGTFSLEMSAPHHQPNPREAGVRCMVGHAAAWCCLAVFRLTCSRIVLAVQAPPQLCLPQLFL